MAADPSDPTTAPGAAGAPIDEQEALHRLRQSEDHSQRYYAAWWLGRNRSRHPDTVPLLLEALMQRQPREQGAGVEENAVARNAARALGKLHSPLAIPDLIACLADEDEGLREAAARALGDLGASVAVPDICRRLAGGPEQAGAPVEGSTRLQEPCEALLEALGDIGVGGPEVESLIEAFVHHERPLVRSAACRALLQLSGDKRWAGPLVELLSHPQLQIRRAALMDLGAVGWRYALEPICQTLAENSLKLIALRGLVENKRTLNPDEPDTTAVLTAMDSLL